MEVEKEDRHGLDSPCADSRGEDGSIGYSLGHELIDAFLAFAMGRSRPNTVRAYADTTSRSSSASSPRTPSR